MIVVRPDQADVIDRVRAEYRGGARAVLMQGATGFGKTTVAATCLARTVALGYRAVFAAHLDALIDDTAERLAAAGVHTGIVQADRTPDPTAPVQVCSLQTVHARRKRAGINLPPADLFVLDECFPAGETVDGTPIEKLRVGDHVWSMRTSGDVERRPIVRVFRSEARNLVRVVLADGRAFVCTPNHPICTGDRYVAAALLGPGDSVLALRVTHDGRDEAARGELSGSEPDLLLASLRQGGASSELPASRLFGECTGEEARADAGVEPDEGSICAGAHVGHTARHRASAEDAWWQRPADCTDAEGAGGCARVGRGGRGAHEDGPRKRVPEQLQDRHREPGREDRDRGGRLEPLLAGASSAGQKEGGSPSLARVDRVEVLEPRGGGGPGRVPVFNLEVEGNHNYFVNGVLVHNCHRAEGPTVRAILEAYPNADILGLTATPQRGDGKPLGRPGGIFDALVCGPSVRELTAAGHLVPSVLYAPPSPEDALAMHPVDAYVRWGAGTPAIVFASGVEHAEEIAAELRLRSYPAVVVVGETPRAERREARARLARGEKLVLVGCGVFVEGWDSPEIETVVLARGFSVAGSFLQAIGRGLRVCRRFGKTACTVIDLRGAALLHGLPDEDRVWRLTGKAVRRTETMRALQRCDECLALFRPATRCPRCGAERAASTRVPRVLNRAEKMEKISHLPQWKRDEKYLSSLVAVAIRRMRMEPRRAHAWAGAQFQKRFSRAPETAPMEASA